MNYDKTLELLSLLKSFACHICILYSPGPVPAVLAHKMGIWSNPIKSGLIQHTSKIKSQ